MVGSKRNQMEQKSIKQNSATTTTQQNTSEDRSFFDLRTSHGQILFLFVTIGITSLIQLIPSETLATSFSFLTNRVDNERQISVQESCAMQNQSQLIKPRKPKYWTYVINNRDDHLKHVHAVLDRFGFERSTNESDWDLLWAHDYPFRVFYPKLHNLKPHQRVNHFPGCGFLTNKVDLACSDSNNKYIPRAFKLPEDKVACMEYARKNPNTLFVQKHFQHRHIFIKSIKDMDLNDNNTFIQEYITNPLLVDGQKFDIGVYVIITSINPLRVYLYMGDVLFRYCAIKYHPFDPKNVDKYIVGDDYMPTWEIPTLSKYYQGLGYGMKDSFDAYLKSKGREPDVIWKQVEEAVTQTIVSNEKLLVNALKPYKSKRNFFEMMRFDLIIDDNLKVYLMEANMSPNLSSAHFLPNELLYEQVIYHMFNLVGVGSPLDRTSFRRSATTVEEMISSNKNIFINGDICGQVPCTDSCAPEICSLCRPCLSKDDEQDLHDAYREHIRKGDTKRIYPKIVDGKIENLENLSEKNKLMSKWFAGKCKLNSEWC